jgi:aspartate racemase
VLVPDADDRAAVHRSSTTSSAEASSARSRARLYRQVIERLVAAGAQGIVLGCTEIELLIGQADSPVPVFPTPGCTSRPALDASLQPGPLATAR